MKKRFHPMNVWLLAVLILNPILWDASANAGGFEDDDFSLRFTAALSRFASYGDVAAAGGASAGFKWQSSINPAAAAWLGIKSPHRLSISPQYSALSFSEGTVFHVVPVTLTWDMGETGTIQPTVAKSWTNQETTRDGLGFDYEINFGQLQWAKRFTSKWGLGLNFNGGSSQINNDLGPFRAAESSSDSYGVRLGGLYQATDQLLLGVVIDYAVTDTDTTIFDVLGVGFGRIDLSDTTNQLLVRSGLSYEYEKDSSILLDFEFGSFSNDTGNLHVSRVYAGIDHKFSQWLYARIGFAFDKEVNDAWTCGLGFYPAEWFGLDIGYQYDMFPELEPEFGRSQTLAISLGLQF